MRQPIEAPFKEPLIADWSEVGLGLVAVVFAFLGHPLGHVVAVNGALCHGAYALRLATRFSTPLWWWDVACNVCMLLHVNSHACAQPFCAGVTALACSAWKFNNAAPEYDPAVHASLVQLPLFLGLSHFTNHC